MYLLCCIFLFLNFVHIILLPMKGSGSCIETQLAGSLHLGPLWDSPVPRVAPGPNWVPCQVLHGDTRQGPCVPGDSIEPTT